MVAVLVDEYRPAPRRSLLSAVDEYVAGPRNDDSLERHAGDSVAPVRRNAPARKASVSSAALSPAALSSAELSSAALSSAAIATPAVPAPVQPRPRTVRPVQTSARQRSVGGARERSVDGARRRAVDPAQSRVAKSTPVAPEVAGVLRADWSVARTLAVPTPRKSLAPTHVLRSSQRRSAAQVAVRSTEPVAMSMGAHAIRSASRFALRSVSSPSSRASVYLRRRIAVGVCALLAMLSMWGLFSVFGGASLVASEHRPTTVTYTVRGGDSLWSVARHVAPSDDPRRVVADLERARGGAPLLPGETVIWTR